MDLAIHSFSLQLNSELFRTVLQSCRALKALFNLVHLYTNVSCLSKLEQQGLFIGTAHYTVVRKIL